MDSMARERVSDQDTYDCQHEKRIGEQVQEAGSWMPTSESNVGVPRIEKDTASNAAEKKARRNFYGAFTERVLLKTGAHDEEAAVIPPTGTSPAAREQVLTWHRWVDLSHRVPEASARLFCFPWAGGNSLAFDAWSEHLPGVEVVPICLPGRHMRAAETALTCVAEIVDKTVEALRGLHLITNGGILFSVFGHELGALLAFELCRRVEGDLPAHALFVSGMTCPQVVHMRDKLSSLCQVSPDGQVLHSKNIEFEEAVRRRGDVPPEVSENRDLMELFTPLWYADFRAADTYEYRGGPLLHCPILSFGGQSGGEQNLDAWGMETSSTKNSSTLYPGRFLYLVDPANKEKILRSLLEFLREEINTEVEEPVHGDERSEDEDSDP